MALQNPRFRYRNSPGHVGAAKGAAEGAAEGATA